MAHVPAHLFNIAQKRWDGVQSDAGAAAAFFIAVDAGRLHSGNHAGKTRGPSGRVVTGFSGEYDRPGRREKRGIQPFGLVPKTGTNPCPFCTLLGFVDGRLRLLFCMAGTTRLELATSAVTGQRSNQLNYVPTAKIKDLR